LIDLLIHACPGARAHFLAAWLKDDLGNAGFDVGSTVNTPFFKIHHVDNVNVDLNTIKKFQGTKIRIKTTFKMLDLQLLLFLQKNLHKQLLDFTRDEFGIETFSKVYRSAVDWFAEESLLDYSLYDYVITFDDTFNIDKLVDLYYQYNKRLPTNEHLELAQQNNKINQIVLDPNHACSIAAMILETESQIKLSEKNRYWSVVDVYETTPVTQLYQTVKSLIMLDNYAS
jgi:hypothetical protein